MNPQDPHTLTPDAPDDATEAQEADDAVTGQVTDAKPSEVTPSKEPPDSAKVGTMTKKTSSKKTDDKKETHWISIELKHEDGTPVAKEPYLIKLPSGKKLAGRLDDKGKAKIENLTETGQAEVNFQRICKKEWKKA